MINILIINEFCMIFLLGEEKMTDQVLVQFKVDRSLKNEVSALYESIGLDLPTAFRMFLIKSKSVGGLPFEAKIEKNKKLSLEDGLSAFWALRGQSSELPDMSLDEINEEIQKTRQSRKN